MKKTLNILMAFMMVFAVIALQAQAGPNCSADKTSAEKAACTSSKTTASLANHKAACSDADKAACMTKYGISEEECKALCKEIGENSVLTSISIEGMTCGGCEKSVTAALKEVPGVVKVIKVSHTTGRALVAVDPAKNKSDFLTKAVADKGFKAEIVPAVAHIGGDKVDAKLVNSKSCSSAEKAACAKSCGSKGTTATKASAKTETKATKSSGGTR